MEIISKKYTNQTKDINSRSQTSIILQLCYVLWVMRMLFRLGSGFGGWVEGFGGEGLPDYITSKGTILILAFGIFAKELFGHNVLIIGFEQSLDASNSGRNGHEQPS